MRALNVTEMRRRHTTDGAIDECQWLTVIVGGIQIGRVRGPRARLSSEQRKPSDPVEEFQGGRRLGVHGESVRTRAGPLRLLGSRGPLVALVRPSHPTDDVYDAQRRLGRMPPLVQHGARIPLQIAEPPGETIQVLHQLRRQHLFQRAQSIQRAHAGPRLYLQRADIVQQQ